MFLEIRLKIYQFFKKNKNKIIIILVLLGIVFLINQYLKNYDFKEIPSTTYEPDTPIMTTQGQEVPNNLKEPIHALIEQYFKLCNGKKYEEAYNMLSDNCKEDMFSNIEDFQIHVDKVFYTNMVYTIQNYYNEDDKYVYRLRIFEDILATGLTGQDELGYRTEVITIHNNGNGMKLAVNGYVEKEEMQSAVYEDENLKITVVNLKKEYEKETYTVKVYNKTEHYVLLADHITQNEIELQLDAETRLMKNNSNTDLIIASGKTKEFEIEFTKYYHESDLSRAILFNYVRVIDKFPILYDEEKNATNTIESYSIKVNMQQPNK